MKKVLYATACARVIGLTVFIYQTAAKHHDSKTVWQEQKRSRRGSYIRHRNNSSAIAEIARVFLAILDHG